MTRVAGRYLSALLLACAGLAISSCAADTKPQQAAQQLADEVTQTVCDLFERCCVAASFPFQEQGCKALNRPKILQHFSAQAFLGSELDSDAAKRCMDAIAQVGDGCPVADYLTDACNDLFKGTVPLGGECDPGHGCASSPDARLSCLRAYHEDSGYEYSGVCVAGPSRYVHNSLGQACNQSCTVEDGPCVSFGYADSTAPASEGTCFASDGLYCDEQSQQCELLGVSGSPCVGEHKQCAIGSYCDSEDSLCAPIRPPGAPCTDASQCGENACTEGTCQSVIRASAALCAGQPPTAPVRPTGPMTGG